MFLVGERLDAVNIGGGVGTGECGPQEIVDGCRSEIAVIDDDHQRETVDGVLGIERIAEPVDGGFGSAVMV